MSTKSPCVLLLSGGLDSATVLAIAIARSFDVYALSFRYGQRHDVEITAASVIATKAGVIAHKIIDIDLRQFGGSALTADIDVPKNRPAEDHTDVIPVTYVPARNTIFLSYAIAWAEVLKARDVFIGVNALDYSGYPDCRPAYIAAFEAMANLATREGVEGRGLRIHAPLIELTKADIIQYGLALGVDYSLTVTCYDPTFDGACGSCDACLIRLRAFSTNGMCDPARYYKGV